MVLQIAETRFAVRSDYMPFSSWLADTLGGFVSEQDPHLRLKVSFDTVPRENDTGHSLINETAEYDYEQDELNLKMVCSHPERLFFQMLQICLSCAMVIKHPADLVLHSSGVVHDNMAYIFSGESGAGKSTICKLLADDPAFFILHDEAVAISQTEDGFRAWSTPFRGEMPASGSVGADLRAIFILKQDHINFATRVGGREAASLFYLNLMPPIVSTNGRLSSDITEATKTMLALVGSVPCYELHFRPERSFWECIPRLFDDESAGVEEKGGSLWQTIAV